jgi:hypothetical protein
VLSASTSGFGFFIPLERSRRALQGYENRLVIRAKLRPLLAMQKGSICMMSIFWRAQRCYVDRTFVLSDISSNICSYEAQRCYVHNGVDVGQYHASTKVPSEHTEPLCMLKQRRVGRQREHKGSICRQWGYKAYNERYFESTKVPFTHFP